MLYRCTECGVVLEVEELVNETGLCDYCAWLTEQRAESWQSQQVEVTTDEIPF